MVCSRLGSGLGLGLGLGSRLELGLGLGVRSSWMACSRLGLGVGLGVGVGVGVDGLQPVGDGALPLLLEREQLALVHHALLALAQLAPQRRQLELVLYSGQLVS